MGLACFQKEFYQEVKRKTKSIKGKANGEERMCIWAPVSHPEVTPSSQPGLVRQQDPHPACLPQLLGFGGFSSSFRACFPIGPPRGYLPSALARLRSIPPTYGLCPEHPSKSDGCSPACPPVIFFGSGSGSSAPQFLSPVFCLKCAH